MLEASVAREVQNELTVLFKRLSGEDLGEEISRVGLTRDVLHDHSTSSTQLAHLEELAIHVTRILC